MTKLTSNNKRNCIVIHLNDRSLEDVEANIKRAKEILWLEVLELTEDNPIEISLKWSYQYRYFDRVGGERLTDIFTGLPSGLEALRNIRYYADFSRLRVILTVDIPPHPPCG